VAQAVPREVEGIDLDLRLRALGDEADIAVRDAGFDLEMAVERRLVSRHFLRRIVHHSSCAFPSSKRACAPPRTRFLLLWIVGRGS
jgi:hypothetical protein